MDKFRRIQQLEELFDSDDAPTGEEFAKLNRELSELHDEIEKPRMERKRQRERELEELREELEHEKIMSLTEEDVDKMYEDSCIKHQGVNGMPFKTWYEKSRKYYTIDENHTVHARARSKKTVEHVPHPTLAQAKYTILKRIRYKFYDHAVKGCDYAWDIE